MFEKKNWSSVFFFLKGPKRGTQTLKFKGACTYVPMWFCKYRKLKATERDRSKKRVRNTNTVPGIWVFTLQLWFLFIFYLYLFH